MLLKLALRNIIRHRKNSLLIILFMITIGSVFMAGTSLLVTINQSMKEGFRNSITGDYVLMSHSEETMSLFGAVIPSISEFFTLPRLKNQNEIEEILLKTDAIDDWTPIISGNAVMDIGRLREGVLFFGMDFEDYLQIFPELEILEQDMTTSGKGVYISEKFLRHLEENEKQPLSIGDEIKLTTLGDTGFKIRQIPIRGIYRYPFESPMIDRILLLDQKTARSLISVLSNQISDTSPEDSSDLLDLDLDSFFSDDLTESTEEKNSNNDILSSLESFLEEKPLESENDGSWHFLLVRLKEGYGYKKSGRLLQNEINGLNLDLLNWRQAAGQNATYAFLLQVFFYSGFFLILIAGIIGIINMMLIALYNRIKEIGTMQALGADNPFIFKLLSCEYFIISLIGTFFSLILCYILFKLVNGLEIRINNQIINLIFGGKPLFFPFSVPLVFFTLLVTLISGALSAFFPIKKALLLEPVNALKGID